MANHGASGIEIELETHEKYTYKWNEVAKKPLPCWMQARTLLQRTSNSTFVMPRTPLNILIRCTTHRLLWKKRKPLSGNTSRKLWQKKQPHRKKPETVTESDVAIGDRFRNLTTGEICEVVGLTEHCRGTQMTAPYPEQTAILPSRKTFRINSC